MNFREGLHNVYKNSNGVELNNPFLLYCRLRDLCADSYEDREKVELFYQINSRLNVVQAILKQDGSVYNRYEEVSDLVSESSYKGLISIMEKVLSPNYQELPKVATAQSSRTPKMGTAPVPAPKKPTQNAVVYQTEQPQETETRTPLNTPSPTYYSGGGGYRSGNSWIVFAIVGGIVALLAMVIPNLLKEGFSWTVWQWIIGGVGGAGLLGFSAWLTYWLDDEVCTDYYVGGTIILGIEIVLNLILLLIFGAGYKIIFYCISIFALIGGIILTCITFSDIEEEWGAGQIVELGMAVLFMIVGIFL